MADTENEYGPAGEAIYFLELLRPGGPWVLTAIVPDGHTETITATSHEDVILFVEANNGRRNCYYSVNPTRTALTSKAKKIDISAIEYLYADLDPRHDESAEAAKERYLAALAAHHPPCTAIINSGNGIQALWKLAVPIVLPDPSTSEWRTIVDDIEGRMRALMQRLGSVAGTQNIDRILRLPGTLNIPNKTKLKIGRVRCPTAQIRFNGAADVLDAFPEPERDEQQSSDAPPHSADELFDKLSAGLKKLIASPPFAGEDTSVTAASVIEQLQKLGCTDADIIAQFRAHPKGIGKRYAEGKDLHADVARIRRKFQSSKASNKSVGKATLVKLGKPRAVRWLWQWHLKRGSIEILAGEPGLGKTQILLSHVATITAGKPWPNGDPAPAVRQKMIMLVAEDNLDDELNPRLLAAGADVEHVRVLKCIRKDENDEHFIVSEHLVELENAIKELGDVALVTIDPITSFLGTSNKIDSHKAQDVRSVLRGLQDVLEREKIACSMITHPSKSAGAKPLDHFIGSQATAWPLTNRAKAKAEAIDQKWRMDSSQMVATVSYY